jgi:WD40 repeat protein
MNHFRFLAVGAVTALILYANSFVLHSASGQVVTPMASQATPQPGSSPATGEVAKDGQAPGIQSKQGESPLPPNVLLRLGNDSPKSASAVIALAYSTDGKLLRAANSNGQISTWDVKSGKRLHVVEVGANVTAVAFSTDGKAFAAATDKAIRLYGANDKFRKLLGHKQTITDLAFSPDTKFLVSRSNDQSLWLWRASDGKKVYTIEGDSNEANTTPNGVGGASVSSRLAFSQDGKFLFAASSFSTVVKVRDAATGKEVRSIPTSGAIQALAVAPDGKTLVVANGVTSAWQYEIATGQLRSKLAGIAPVNFYPTTIHGMGFTGQGQGFCIGLGGSANGTGGVCGTGNTGGFGGGMPGNKQFGGGFCFGGGGFNFNNLGGNFGSGFNPGAGFSVGSGFGTFNPHGFPSQPAMHPNDQILQGATASGHGSTVIALAFAPKGKIIATAELNGTILLWNSLSTKLLFAVGQHIGPVTCLAFASDGKSLASAGANGGITIWKVASSSLTKSSLAQQWWNDLANPLAPQANRAMQELAGQPEASIALFKEKLQPVKLSSDQIRQWLEDLNSGHYPTRAKATKELEKIVEDIEPALLELLKNPPSLEVHLRVQLLLAKLPKGAPSPARLRQSRALEILEQLDTSAARQLLQALAQGTPEAWLTREAQKTLDRLKE